MKTNNQRFIKGFTIVELVIVIVIIGLLTAIVSVSYSNYQKRSVGSVIKADLVSAQGALKLSVINENNQNFGLPGDYKASQDVSVNIYGESIKEYCIEGSHSKYSDLKYYLLSSEKEPGSGACFSNQISPVGWWKLNGNGTDSSGYGRTAVVTGATAVANMYGDTNSAYSFSALNNYLTTSGSPQPNTKLTLTAWINPSSYPVTRATIMVTQYYLSLGSNGSVQSYWYGTSPAGYHTTSGSLVPLNSWSFIAASWDGTWAKLYVNGTERTRVAVTGTGNNSTNMRIGMQGSDTTRQFYGVMDDLRIYGRALSDSEMLALYNAGPQ